MCAQRFTEAEITAVDIELTAVAAAQKKYGPVSLVRSCKFASHRHTALYADTFIPTHHL